MQSAIPSTTLPLSFPLFGGSSWIMGHRPRLRRPMIYRHANHVASPFSLSFLPLPDPPSFMAARQPARTLPCLPSAAKRDCHIDKLRNKDAPPATAIGDRDDRHRDRSLWRDRMGLHHGSREQERGRGREGGGQVEQDALQIHTNGRSSFRPSHGIVHFTCRVISVAP